MLELTIEGELFDPGSDTFVVVPPTTVRLEHSLISISKWESIHEKPWLATREDSPPKTEAEMISYVDCMIIGKMPSHIADLVYAQYAYEIQEYIQAPNSATIISKRAPNITRPVGSGPYISSELIYYWMIAFNIPYAFEKWHINRLLNLIEICNIKNNNKKMPVNDALRQKRELNERRRAAHNIRG
jgi:hypothetical protein